MRTQASYYLKGLPGSASVNEKIFTCQTKDEFFKVLEDYLKKLNN